MASIRVTWKRKKPNTPTKQEISFKLYCRRVPESEAKVLRNVSKKHEKREGTNGGAKKRRTKKIGGEGIADQLSGGVPQERIAGCKGKIHAEVRLRPSLVWCKRVLHNDKKRQRGGVGSRRREEKVQDIL